MPKYEPSMNEQYESPLVSRVIEQMRSAFEIGDVEAVDELLRFCPRVNLIQYIDEEEWGKWATKKELEAIYGKGQVPDFQLILADKNFQADMDAQDSKWGKHKV